MREFFQNPDVADDPIYRRLGTACASPLLEARSFIERTWAACGQFLDSDALKRATQEFYPVWWELYLAYCLHAVGVSLAARTDRIYRGKGRPDLFTDNPRLWIEAVMPTPGDGPDRLSEPQPGEVFAVPTDAFVLRLRSAVQEKIVKLRRYIADGTIPSGDAMIIAVSGGRLPFRYTEQPIPAIVRAVYGVGSLTLELDSATKKIAGHSVEYRDHVVKKSESLVMTDVFLQRENAHVSAVLYSASDCVNRPKNPGQDFILVHNPNALARVPDGWLPVGDEYRIEAGALCRKRAGDEG